ncbi:MAG: hypothetical protein U0R71_17630 [Solirubrobacterales bacterium]
MNGEPFPLIRAAEARVGDLVRPMEAQDFRLVAAVVRDRLDAPVLAVPGGAFAFGPDELVEVVRGAARPSGRPDR